MQRSKKRWAPFVIAAVAVIALIAIQIAKDDHPPRTPMFVDAVAPIPVAPAEPAPIAQAEPIAEPEPVPAPEPAPMPAPIVKKRAQPKPAARPKDPEPVAAPEPEPDPEPAAAPEPQAEPAVAEAPKALEAPSNVVPDEPLPPFEPAPPPTGNVEIMFTEDLAWLKAKSIEVLVDQRPVAVKNFGDAKNVIAARVLAEKLTAGRHQAELRIRLSGESSIFSYVEGYAFTMKQPVTIDVAGNDTVRIIVTAVERNPTDDWKDRVGLEVQVQRPQNPRI